MKARVDPVLGGAGVDRDDAVIGRDEREVAKVVALSEQDARLRAHDRGRGEAEPLLRRS